MFLVSKHNLKPFYSHIWRTKNCEKRNGIEKVTIPQSKGGQRLKKQTTKPLEHPNFLSYVAQLLLESKIIYMTSGGAAIAL